MRKLMLTIWVSCVVQTWASGIVFAQSLALKPQDQIISSSHSFEQTRMGHDCRNLGMNLAGLSYFSAENPFVDLMLTSGAWIRPWGTKNAAIPISMDKEGNPLSTAPDPLLVRMVSCLVWTHDAPKEPYILTWQGDGQLGIQGNARVDHVAQHKIIFHFLKPASGAALESDFNVWLTLSGVSASDPVRNIHIVKAMDDGHDKVFNQAFIDSISQFKSLRFMDWEAMNTNTLQKWSDRTSVESNQADMKKGVAYEYIIQLANQLNINPWINIPVRADDEFIAKMAALFHQRIKPGLTVYVEYSNEVWNTMFPQAQWVSLLAASDGISAYQEYSKRVARIADIWHKEFSKNTTKGPKLVVLMAGQAANPSVLQQEMQYNNNGYSVDGVSVAYYAGGIAPGEANQWRSVAPDTVARRTFTDVIGTPTIKGTPTWMIKANMDIGKSYGKPMFIYEGGQNYVPFGQEPNGKWMGDDEQMVDLMKKINHSSEMNIGYEALLTQWENLGSPVFMLFTSTARDSKWGFWGIREFEYTPVNQAPKLQGVYDFCGWPN